MFVEMRDVLGIPKSIDILDHIYSLSPESKQEEAMEKIRGIERRNMSAYASSFPPLVYLGNSHTRKTDKSPSRDSSP